MGKIIGNACAYVAMIAVILAVLAVSLIALGFLCWLAFFIWAHVFAFFV
ncbi:hypothetical protein [Limosilactobacillus caviae]|uniref:Uncharacterized protein n=1 Tax=Limosilactobacillus caviae TaxID=1769424 RepID=A0ABQ2C351_9LACO|nr:hypothetical protein [Limosilactobacillus caviae]MRH47358.1 hypothetical protein [Limosilactobacillus reuteri]MCD7123666.1 hypothetical protein [Limosilactobacillus caviae]MCD7124047.1 hypothetical protein [Limosilactobacillus caviae]MCD7124645.1 hypothetical protein [Limosilactobacillus caviae]MCD7124649.1 hypothetical protein [Limosilactobacillus caviae]